MAPCWRSLIISCQCHRYGAIRALFRRIVINFGNGFK
ncbi:hypothetical protein LTSEINV_0179, partial [Salmonella enterica subsp. enterica serovar Inverness str. R8-3668]